MYISSDSLSSVARFEVASFLTFVFPLSLLLGQSFAICPSPPEVKQNPFLLYSFFLAELPSLLNFFFDLCCGFFG